MYRLVSAILMLVFAAAVLPAAAFAQSSSPDVPSTLRVPDGNVLLFRAFAAGTQNYDCGPDGAWVFRQPKAVLVGDDGQPLGIHGRGPFWVAYDGSAVVGSAPVSAPADDAAHDIPWLLLKGAPSTTDGRFSTVSYIQRLDTQGGVAPTSVCDPSADAALAVPYVAVYYFYGPA